MKGRIRHRYTAWAALLGVLFLALLPAALAARLAADPLAFVAVCTVAGESAAGSERATLPAGDAQRGAHCPACVTGAGEPVLPPPPLAALTLPPAPALGLQPSDGTRLPSFLARHTPLQSRAPPSV